MTFRFMETGKYSILSCCLVLKLKFVDLIISFKFVCGLFLFRGRGMLAFEVLVLSQGKPDMPS